MKRNEIQSGLESRYEKQNEEVSLPEKYMWQQNFKWLNDKLIRCLCILNKYNSFFLDNNSEKLFDGNIGIQ